VFKVEIALTIDDLLQSGNIITAQRKIHLSFAPLKRAQQLRPPLPAHLKLHAYQGMPKFRNYSRRFFDAAENDHRSSSVCLQLHPYQLAVWCQCSGDHFFSER
jgi:hypothetical protein